MFQGLEHAGIASPDPEKLAQWYVEHFGFRINYQSPSTKTTFLRAPNGSMFEIILSDGERTGATMRTPGLRHLAIAVEDFDSAFAALRGKGVAFVTEPQESKGNRVVFFTDPDGNLLHLIQRATPLP